MSQLFYYDKSGNKKPTTVSELKTLASSGAIDRHTVVETDDGRRAPAEKVKGLEFPESPVTSAPQVPFPNVMSGPAAQSQTSPKPQNANAGATAQNIAPQSCGGNPFDTPQAICRQCGARIKPHQAFCSNCGAPQNGSVPPAFAAPSSQMATGDKPSNKVVAGVLALLLGGIGIHKFYLGSWGWGLIYVIFFCTSIPALFGLVEGIIYLTMSDDAFNDKYNRTPKSAFRW